MLKVTSEQTSFLERRWVIRFFRLSSLVIYWIGFISVTISLAAANHTEGNKGWAFLIFIPIFGFLATAIHESGHFVAARWLNMLVTHARIGVVELLARRHTWKLRLRRSQVR